MRILMSIACGLLFLLNNASAQVKERYPSIHGGAYVDPVVSASPDPLIRYRWKKPLATDSLQVYSVSPQKITGLPENAFKKRGDRITVTANGDLFLDFGTETAGWLEFDSNDLADSVAMSISEYNEPAIVNAGAQNPVKTKTAVKYGHTYRLELNDELYEGVRFAWIHVNNFSKPWHIKNIRLVCQVKPVNYNGSFHTSDSILNRIWYTGAYVVKLNMLQDYFGAILMERSDRHSWTGDAYPAQAAALAAFGNYDVIKKNIAFTADQDNGIAAYSVYWVLSLIDYYNYTGDTVFLKTYAANADKRLEKAYLQYDTLPNLGFMGWDERLGAGFENTQIEEAGHAYKMLCINGWKQFAKAMITVNDTGRLAVKYQQFATIKTKQLLNNRQAIHRYGIHAIAEAINAGLLNEGDIQPQAKKLFADRLNRLSYSPFNQYFIIQAMAMANQYTTALSAITDCWGGQIRYGGTSFFEVYRPSWNEILKNNDAPPNNQCGYTSLAHPWGAGVTKWLSENILGIKPVEPGFKRFTIIPFAGKLTQVKGAMPTPFGSITAAFDLVSGQCEITIPEGTLAEKVAFPKAGRSITGIRIDKKINGDKGAFKMIATGDTTTDDNYVYLKNISPGHYKINIDYAWPFHQTEETEVPFNYPVQSFTQDSITSGGWQHIYGKDGYAFFGYPASDSMKKLPVYIDSITIKKSGVIVWDSLGTDSRALVQPVAKKQLTAAIVTRDPIPCDQTMTIDIAVKEKHPYRLAVYFLDWDKKNRRSAIELFDPETMNIIAPVQLVGQYENGKYVSFSFNKSIRIRINQIRGQNAAVSGIFFDAPQ